MRVVNGKIVTTQRNLNRLFYGTHQPWEVLSAEGGILLVGPDALRLSKGRKPYKEIVGVEFEEHQLRFLSPLLLKGTKFITSIPTTGETLRVKECRVPGHPGLIIAAAI